MRKVPADLLAGVELLDPIDDVQREFAAALRRMAERLELGGSVVDAVDHRFLGSDGRVYRVFADLRVEGVVG